MPRGGPGGSVSQLDSTLSSDEENGRRLEG